MFEPLGVVCDELRRCWVFWRVNGGGAALLGVHIRVLSVCEEMTVALAKMVM